MKSYIFTEEKQDVLCVLLLIRYSKFYGLCYSVRYLSQILFLILDVVVHFSDDRFYMTHHISEKAMMKGSLLFGNQD